ncbi:DNA oxidative demethylase [Bertholletia excelsa]
MHSRLFCIQRQFYRKVSFPRKMSLRGSSGPTPEPGIQCEIVGLYEHSIDVSTGAKIDLRAQLEPRLDKTPENIVSSQLEGSPKRKTNPGVRDEPEPILDERPEDIALSLCMDSEEANLRMLPTSFGKKHFPSTRKQKVRQMHAKYSEGYVKTDLSKGLPVIKPFDICSPNNSLHSENKEPLSENKASMGENKQVLREGMILLKNYIPLSEQVQIVKTCRELGVGPGGFYQPGYKDGAKLRLQMMCLGLDWDPQTRKYKEMREIDGSTPPSIPCEFKEPVKRAIQDSHAIIKKNGVKNAEGVIPDMSPNICIVNFYTTTGRLGLHQDRDESKESLQNGLPVVSFSLGDSAEFLYGDQRDVDKAEKVILESGDVLIFGGKSRHIFHGVHSILPNSAPTKLSEESKLRPGRLNLTFREY